MEIQLLECEKSYQKLLAHRQEVYEYSRVGHLTYGSSQFDVDLHQDKTSHIFCGIVDDEIVASCRITEFRYLDTAFQQWVIALSPELNTDKTFMISRLCISTVHQGRRLYKRILAHVCTWAEQNHHNQFYLAKCKVGLELLYRTFGCEVIEGSRDFDEQVGDEYLLLLGNIRQTYDILAKRKRRRTSTQYH